MIFTAPKEKLERFISIAQSIVSSKPQINILTNILLETEGDSVKVLSTDLNVGIRTAFEASVERPGAITVSGSKFLGIIRELPSGNIRFEVTDSNDIKIQSDNTQLKARFTLKGIPKESYPPMPSPEDSNKRFSMPQTVLRDMIKKTIFSISYENSREYLRGIYFESEGDRLRLVSTDGRRLSFIERQIDLPGDLNLNLIVPQKVLTELVKYLSDEGEIDIFFSENKIFFSFNNVLFESNLIDGSFPNYNQVIPKKQEKTARLSRSVFLNALKRSLQLVEDKFNQLRMDFSEGHVVLSINNSDQGSYREDLAIDYHGENIEIAFNHKFLLEYVKEIQSEDIIIEMTTPLSPVSFLIDEDAKYTYIVMPMKV